jgi:hypothetical protein
MTLQEEIKELLNPATTLPMPVTTKEDEPWAIIRIKVALIRIAERIDKQNEIVQSIYKTSEKVLLAVGRMDERIDELDEKLESYDIIS